MICRFTWLPTSSNGASTMWVWRKNSWRTVEGIRAQIALHSHCRTRQSGVPRGPGIRAYGALTLNHSVGGLNPVAVEIAGRSGAKIVWMPTVDAANETAGRAGWPNTKLPFWAKIQRELAADGHLAAPLTVLDEDGKVNEATRRCLELHRPA